MATRLVDLSHASIGAVVLGVPTTADYSARAAQVRSGGNSVIGDQRVDKSAFDLACSVSGEDPLSVPVVAALTSSQAVAASGRVSGSATVQKFALAHAVLTGIALSLQEDRSGSVKYSFRNRGTVGTSSMTPLAALAQELIVGTGTARAKATRGRSIQFADGALFTPDDDGIDPVSVALDSFSWNAQADVAADKDVGELIFTQLDVTGWQISGSVGVRDQAVVSTSGLSVVDYLAALGRGTLTIPLKMAGQQAGTPPANQVLTAERVQFYSSSGQQSSGPTFATNTAEFDAEMVSSAGLVLALAAMLTYAPAN
jgi:hypothetical protein